MKKLLIIALLGLAMGAYAQQQKDTVRIERRSLELTTDNGKNQFVITAKDGTTKKVSTDKQSAEHWKNSGVPYVIFNINQFGEKKISKIYVKEA